MNSEDRWDSLIQYHADQAGIDWRVLKTIMLVENIGRSDPIAPLGAHGLMHYAPVTAWRWLDTLFSIGGPPPNGWNESPYDPEVMIRVSAHHLSWLTEALSSQFQPEDLRTAVFYGYFASYTAVMRHLEEFGRLRLEHFPQKTGTFISRAVKVLTMMEAAEHGGSPRSPSAANPWSHHKGPGRKQPRGASR